MGRQTFGGCVQWLVVDDGERPTPTTHNQHYIRRMRRERGHTLVPQLLAALPHVDAPKILIIEDDDYYSPRYVETMTAWLDQYPLVGEKHAKYYHLRYGWFRLGNTRHGSLCRTGFTHEVLPTLRAVLRHPTPWVDMRLWRAWRGAHYLHDDRGDRTNLTIGVKGMPGRRGATWRYHSTYRSDPRGEQLSRWCSGDQEVVSVYRELSARDRVGNPPRELPRVVIFTAIFGDYDRLKQPDKPNPTARYVCFTDQAIADPGWWEIVPTVQTESTPARENRKWKILAHRWFPDADWWIYIDGHMQLRNDPFNLLIALPRDQSPGRAVDVYVTQHELHNCAYAEAAWVAEHRYDRQDVLDAQVARYRAEGYPEQNGCCYCNLLVRRNTPQVREFNETWWREVASGSHRDQISFPVAAWRCGMPYCAMPQRARDRYVRCDLEHRIPRATYI